jgi:phage tail tape-measure protein
MELLGFRFEYILMTCVFILSAFSVYLILSLRKERVRIAKLEQATTHLALALETLNSPNTETEEKARSTSAIIGGIAGGSLGAIWGPVGVIAGSGIGSGIGNLAPDALEKAKSVVGNLKGDSSVDYNSDKKRFPSKIPFLGKKK